MATGWALSYLAIFLQVLAGVVLWRLRGKDDIDRFALRIFAALFFLNAGVSAIMTLPREYAIWLAADRGVITRAFRALDAPTGYLLLAFAVARSRMGPRVGLAWALMAIGVVVGLLEFPFHVAMVENQWLLRALPLYAGLTLAMLQCATGAPWERWIALALVPRALYWGTTGVASVLDEGLGVEVNVYANRLGLLALALAAVVASVRMLRASGGPTSGVAVPVLLIGPACALLELALSASVDPSQPVWFGSIVLVNLVTLGLVRPVVTLAGLAPSALVGVTGRAAIAAALGAVSTLLVSARLPTRGPGALDIAIDEALSFGFGLMVGLLALAIAESVSGAARREPSATRLDIGGAQPAHWQLLILALRGSREATVPAYGLTQKGVADRTGLRTSRISTLVRELNEASAPRLEGYVPGWRARTREAQAVLIEQYKGALAGHPGVWTYYRLTSVGEELATALAATLDRQKETSNT